jgi:hypothetical protein
MRRYHKKFLGVWVFAALVWMGAFASQGGKARGQSGDCTPGNLLAGKLPVHWQDTKNKLELVTDGEASHEGAVWDAPTAVILDSPVSTLTYDLGREVSLQAIFMQGDANDAYTVWGSPDNATWTTLGRVEPVDGVHGLRSRPLGLGGARLRFLKIGEGVGDNFYSISELQAFCQLPTPFPPPLKLVKGAKQKFDEPFWNDTTSRRWELFLAIAVLALLHWGVILEREGRPHHRRRLRDGLLKLSLVVGAFTYINFGFFHFGNFIHSWDTYHYYVGTKYFKELGYERLYECSTIADYEVPALKRRVELRKITNLRTNDLETTADILKHPERCKSHFSEERWRAFTRDIAYFRDKEAPKRWDDTLTDHGYNATPVWNILGTVLANTGPATKTQITLLNIIDQVYYAGMIAMVWWAFGWRVTAVALVVFATNFPSRFYWTGGAFLRWDWLFYLVASICFMRKGHPLVAGLALGYSTLLRIFPGFMFMGPLAALAIDLFDTRKKTGRLFPLSEPSRKYVTFFLGAALAAAVLVPISLKTSHGLVSYKEFVRNSIKHKETPLTNYMGLRTVVAYRPSESGSKMRDNRLTDPWIGWKNARIRAYHEAMPLFIAIALGFVVLIGWASRGRDPWMSLAFGVTFIPIASELTCYYYAFIIGVALLAEKKEVVGRLLLGLTALTEFISLHPLPGMPSWIDEQYTLISAVTIAAFGMILWWFGPGPWWQQRQLAATGTEGTTSEKDANTSVDPSASPSDSRAEDERAGAKKRSRGGPSSRPRGKPRRR